MFLKGSRYERVKGFDLDEDGNEVFAGVRPRTIDAAFGVVEHVVKAGERLDLLARYYYNDDRLWWRIVDANPRFVFGGNIFSEDMEGEVIVIPKAKE